MIDDNSTRPDIHFDRGYKCLNYRGTTDQELDVASLLRPTKSMSAWLYGPGENSSVRILNSPAIESNIQIGTSYHYFVSIFLLLDVRLLTPRMAALRTLKTTLNSLKSTRSLLFNHDHERQCSVFYKFSTHKN